MRHQKINVKFYVGSILLSIGAITMFFYLGLSGFCIHVPQIENLIPEEDEPLVLALFLMGTAIFELVIYCLDTEIYAQNQWQANLRKQKILHEYDEVIASKDEKLQLLLNRYVQLMKLTMDNARELFAVSEDVKLKEDDLKNSIQQLQSSILEITLLSEDRANNIIPLRFASDSSKKNLASLKRTDVCVQLRENAKNNMKAERQQIVELEVEVGRLYPVFLKSLYEFFPNLSDKQMNLCLLMKAGFSTVEIASLLCLHYSSVSHMKSRLFKSLDIDGVTDLNDFLTKL